ncbi:GNAT family N-acetyltransferase [Bacillus sp. FJAT-42376]|uniref:GNAT family N-acetyltransferase n=1 Tax=Bacillus sp. FJAT-42376 TaxID=2014076 RepID=UPI000F4FFAA5|nr:GNAT family N-acetyltransferase [Bacillus sp. FJAT-42376]AZB41712.1 GNAT family N-acetyltransferase [Bacillus sp. FJAT-42376]
MTVSWKEITLHNQEGFAEAMAMYDQAFPIEIREPHDVFQNSMRTGSYRFLLGMEGEEILSFATGHYLKEVNAGFIVYLLANPLVRSRGIGTQTLLKLEEWLEEDARSAGCDSIEAIILKTEKLELVHTEEEKEDCVKRTRFYNKNGYQEAKGIRYIQPPLFQGQIPVPLNLYVKNHQQTLPSRERIAEYVQAMYRGKYSLANGVDQAILSDLLAKI